MFLFISLPMFLEVFGVLLQATSRTKAVNGILFVAWPCFITKLSWIHEIISVQSSYMKSCEFICHAQWHFQVVSRCLIFRGWNPKVGSTSNGCTFSERWVLCPEILEFWSNIHQGVAMMFWCFTCVFSLCFPTCRFFYRLKVVKSRLFPKSCDVLLCLPFLAKAERSGWKYIDGTSAFWRFLKFWCVCYNLLATSSFPAF